MIQSRNNRANVIADYGQYGSFDYYDYNDYGSLGKIGSPGSHSGHVSRSSHGSHLTHGVYDKEHECCPLVVDAICLFTLLGAIAAATFFLENLINIEITGKRRRRKKRSSTLAIVNGRKLQLYRSPMIILMCSILRLCNHVSLDLGRQTVRNL